LGGETQIHANKLTHIYKLFYLVHQSADIQHINSIVRGVGGGEHNFLDLFRNTLKWACVE